MPPEEFVPPEPFPRAVDDIRFYVDEDVLGLGLAMTWARRDVVTCGLGPVLGELPRGTLDTDWIPVVAARGWIAVTGNVRIRTHPTESRLALEHGLRVVCLADPRGRMTTWDRLTLLTRHWRAVENHVERCSTGPWWLTVGASGATPRNYRGTS